MIDQNGDIISAEDLDMWGYRMDDRSFQSDTAFYKYTGKERDVTTGYDYFGARYYVSRIGNWTSVDPLFEKHYDFSPYNYVLRNPLNLIDPDGRQVDAAVLREVYRNVIIPTVRTAAPVVGIPVSPLGFAITVLMYVVTPTELGINDVQTSIFWVDEASGDLVWPNPIEEITVTAEERSRINTKKDKVAGAIDQMLEHLDHIYERSEKGKDNPEYKEKWKKDIAKHRDNVVKEASKTKKSVKDVVNEHIRKGRFSKEQIEKMIHELREQGISF